MCQETVSLAKVWVAIAKQTTTEKIFQRNLKNLLTPLDVKRLNKRLTLNKISDKIRTRKERKEKVYEYKITYHLYHLKHY